MNREVVELRQVVEKLVPMLTSSGLKVTQRGSQAYVSVDARTRKPKTVNIPNIPDNASSDFIMAIHGFLDHEVAHVLITDWDVYAGGAAAAKKPDAKFQRFANLHNITEDTMIEREIVKILPGTRKHLSNVRKFFLKNVTEKALATATSPVEEFGYLMVPAMRALAGHVEMQEWMDENGHWEQPVVKELIGKLSDDFKKRMKTASTTKHTYDLAKELEEVLYPSKDEEETPPEGQKGPSQDKPEKKAGEGDGDGARDHSEQEPGDESQAADADAEDQDEAEAENETETTGKTGTDEQEDEADDRDEDADENDGDGEDDEDDAEEASDEDGDADGDTGEDDDPGADGDDAGGDDDPADGGDADDGDADGADADGAGADAGVGDGAGAGDDDAGAAGGDDEGDDASGSLTGDRKINPENSGEEAFNEPGEKTEKDKGGSGVGSAAAKSLFDFEDDAFERADLGSAIADEISKQAVETMSLSDYVVYTREFDRLEPVQVPPNMNEKWVPEMEEEVAGMANRMQKDIERMMASKSLVRNTPGFKSGRIHTPSLYRVTQGDPRVFTQRLETISKRTAVSLVCDNSGSMGGAKMHLAMISAYALAQTLERVNVPAEVIGFTTGDWGDMPSSITRAMNEDTHLSGISYSRVLPLVLPIYKSFDERITPEVKRRFAYMMNAQRGLNGNIDGESILAAAERLVPRKEDRKVMIVLSDGMPAGGRNSDSHLKTVVKELNRSGIDTIGIGIQSDAVKRFYERNVVIHNVGDLLGQVMGQLQKLLA